MRNLEGDTEGGRRAVPPRVSRTTSQHSLNPRWHSNLLSLSRELFKGEKREITVCFRPRTVGQSVVDVVSAGCDSADFFSAGNIRCEFVSRWLAFGSSRKRLGTTFVVRAAMWPEGELTLLYD